MDLMKYSVTMRIRRGEYIKFAWIYQVYFTV